MDVRSIQEALRKVGFDPGLIDGIAGARTKAAIEAFQRANGLKADGIAGPQTLGVLFEGENDLPAFMPPVESGALLSAARLKRMWPRGKAEWITAIVASSGTVLPLHGITSRVRLCHFMAQVSHECGGGTIAEENLYYSAVRMTQVWPSRFRTVAAAAPYAQNGRALANKVYNGRMGNRPGTDDGWNYRGRGLIQITGRDGYAQVGKIAGLDLVGNPSLANEPANLLPVAAAFWTWKGLNKRATDTSDAALIATTKIINGGTNGLADRRSWFFKWHRELGL